MNRHRLACSLAAVVIALSIGLPAQVRLEPAAKPAAGALAEKQASLAPQGHRVVLANGNTLCEIWLASAVASPQRTDTERTNYSAALSVGAFAGAISFPSGARDFRGQAIKPGTYSLRYYLMPNDGAHMGAAPQRDFLLLAPLASDTKPDVAMAAAELLKASSVAAGSNHPAVFLLLPAGEVGKDPTLSLSLPKAGADKGGATAYESPEGYVVFASALKTESGKTVPLALVVKGQAEQ